MDYGWPSGGGASCSQHEHHKGQSVCSGSVVLFILISTQHYNLWVITDLHWRLQTDSEWRRWVAERRLERKHFVSKCVVEILSVTPAVGHCTPRSSLLEVTRKEMILTQPVKEWSGYVIIFDLSDPISFWNGKKQQIIALEKLRKHRIASIFVWKGLRWLIN